MSLVDDAFLWQRMQVGSDVLVVSKSLGIPLNRKDCNLRFHAGDDLVGDRF